MIQAAKPHFTTPREPELSIPQIAERVKTLVGDQAIQVWIADGKPRAQVVLDIHGKDIRDIVGQLKNDAELKMHFLSELTAIDYLKHPDDHPERFAVALFLRNLYRNLELRVRAFVPEDEPRLPSLSSIFRSALWQEREVFDLFGIDFLEHPDMRRIIMPDDYEGHPLRKDYPLQGRGERSNFPMIRPDDIRVLKDTE